MEGGFVDGDNSGMVTRDQLPKDVRPLHYHLMLTPNFSNFTFDGEEGVEIVITEPTDRIVLHAADLIMHQVGVTRDWKTYFPAKIFLDAEKETATFVFPTVLVPGTARVYIKFTGTLNDQMRGFYRSTYTVAGEKHVMAVTQFEPADARRAFPCWDEPAIKARFSLTLKVPRGYEAISNMPVAEEGWVETRNISFKTTPCMSTYLFAMAVGEFEHIEAKTKEGTLVRVIAPIGKNVAKRGTFALEVATKVLSFFNKYFGIAFPLPKIDLFAVPDFAAGAMENWGLVTYQETAILFDPDESSAGAKQRVALAIAHELAHQWFGNLVTMEWWTDLWLNEGFASWIGYLALDHLFPEWNMWTQFVATDMAEALRLDALVNSHPIEVPVTTPAQISETFDAISYSKGASVIRMLHAYLGEEAFRKGLQIYLARFQYGNASTDDLWAALAEASGRPVKEMMDCWTKQSGYPIINVYKDQLPATSKDRQRLICFQSRFLESGTVADETRWDIPLAINGPAFSKPEYPAFAKNLKQIAFEIPAITPDGWIIANPGQVGFWRVCYQDDLFERLIPAVKSKALTPEERFGLQNDATALARAGDFPATKVLTLLEAYREETEYAVWADLAANLGELKTLWAWEPYYEQFCAFARDLFEPVAKRMGWGVTPDDTHQTRLLRALALGAFGGYGDPLTIDLARYYFGHFLNDHNALHPDLRGLVYHLVVKNCDEKTYEDVLNLYRKADLQEEKIRCLQALGASQDSSLLKRTLAFSLSSEVRSQDTVHAILPLAANRHGRELAWQFLQENWAEFDRRYGNGSFLLRYLISSCTEDFASEEKAQEVAAFFENHPAPAARRTIQQSLERIRSNAAWLARDREHVQHWFGKRDTKGQALISVR